MEFMDLPAIRDKRESILDAAAELLGPRGLRVARPARQWEFFLHCLNRTMDPAFQSPFDDLSPSRAAQYKFEVAYRAILNLLNRHRERGWVLNNPLNPSNKRLMSLRIKDLNSGMARIHTTEYWHLFWWNQSTGKYSYSYRETNRQTYLLERRDGEWKILENLRPAPRTSTPNRRVRAR